MLIGAGMGFSTGFIMFRSWGFRRFMTLFGFGAGLGMNYSQLQVLFYSSRGTFDTNKDENRENMLKELDDIGNEMKLWNKLS